MHVLTGSWLAHTKSALRQQTLEDALKWDKLPYNSDKGGKKKTKKRGLLLSFVALDDQPHFVVQYAGFGKLPGLISSWTFGFQTSAPCPEFVCTQDWFLLYFPKCSINKSWSVRKNLRGVSSLYEITSQKRLLVCSAFVIIVLWNTLSLAQPYWDYVMIMYAVYYTKHNLGTVGFNCFAKGVAQVSGSNICQSLLNCPIKRHMGQTNSSKSRC